MGERASGENRPALTRRIRYAMILPLKKIARLVIALGKVTHATHVVTHQLLKVLAHPMPACGLPLNVEFVAAQIAIVQRTSQSAATAFAIQKNRMRRKNEPKKTRAEMRKRIKRGKTVRRAKRQKQTK